MKMNNPTAKYFAIIAMAFALNACAPVMMGGVFGTAMIANLIAAEMGVSVITVKVHRGNVMRKMGAKSLTDLVRMADALGIRRKT